MKSFEVFDSKFNELSKTSQWEKITTIGVNTLQDPSLSNSEKATIHARLASTYFYRGAQFYKDANHHAQLCIKIAKDVPLPKLQVRGLYLLSATNRALKQFVDALSMAQCAIEVYEQHQLNDQTLLGKVYFNYGAAADDNPDGDLNLARDKYLRALECYKATNVSDDILRVVTRLINNSAKCKDVVFANKMLMEISPEMLNLSQRSSGHYYLALSRLNKLEEKTDDARLNAEKSAEIAGRLNAPSDLKRAQDFLLTLPFPKIVGVAHTRSPLKTKPGEHPVQLDKTLEGSEIKKTLYRNNEKNDQA
jgi:tetratricopeptide (TPR) repeat protein